MRVTWHRAPHLGRSEPGLPVYNNDANERDRLNCWNVFISGLVVATVFTLIVTSGTLSFVNPETMQHKTIVSRNAAPPDAITDSQDAAHSASSANSSRNTWMIAGVVIAATALVISLVTFVYNQYLHSKDEESDTTRLEEEQTARAALEKRQEDAANVRINGVVQSINRVVQTLKEFQSVVMNLVLKTQAGGLNVNSRASVQIFENFGEIPAWDKSLPPSETKEQVRFKLAKVHSV